MTATLFWDIDGTLLTTARAGIIAFERAASEVCGHAIDLDELPTAGLTDFQIAGLVAEAAGGTQEDAAAVLASYERHLPECLPLRDGNVLPGVVDILDDLSARADVTLWLLTGNTRGGAGAKLGHYGLGGYFADGAFCVSHTDRDEIARDALALANGDVVYVIGDTPHDVRCGKAIGARTVAVASGGHSAEELAPSEPWLLLERLPSPEGFSELLGLAAHTSSQPA
jgi:phosphoglycolate phosphatase